MSCGLTSIPPPRPPIPSHRCSLLRNNDAHRRVDENKDRAKLLLPLLLVLQLPVRASEPSTPSPPVADIMTREELLMALGRDEAALFPGELRELDRARLSPNPSSSSSSRYHPPRALLPPRALVGVVPLALEKEWFDLARRKPAGAAVGMGEEEEDEEDEDKGGPAEGWRLNM